ncbi:MAG: VWA domain-containing protein [Actinobacteria bacterium]|nr:VWA domain-containing protein [Actinomycetota bacterium]
MTAELARLVAFGRLLRARGLAVGTGRIMAFCRAVAALEPIDREDLYWAARSTLISRKEQLDDFDRAFASYFGPSAAMLTDTTPASGDPRRADRPRVPDDAVELDVAPASWVLPDEDEASEGETTVRLVAGTVEALRSKRFEDLTDEERARAASSIRRIAVAIPRRRARRLRPASRGASFDLRRTLRYSLRTQGEPFHRAWTRRRTKARPLVLILDVSGSMSPYSRALLQFGFAAMAAGQRVEVFCFGTRLTRVTRLLRTKDPNRALKDIAGAVKDWDGGTRIGESLRELLNLYGQRGSMRGAVVVLCSDGLERGDPDLLTAEMARLSRLAHRVVWVNPLKGSPLYEPLARGMAAALPHVDVFLSGHNVASLEELGAVLEG